LAGCVRKRRGSNSDTEQATMDDDAKNETTRGKGEVGSGAHPELAGELGEFGDERGPRKRKVQTVNAASTRQG
jgi:hypothetical protein